jgi:hypothetical protein
VGFDFVAQNDLSARVAGAGLAPGGLGRAVDAVDHLVGDGDRLPGRWAGQPEQRRVAGGFGGLGQGSRHGAGPV